jgi:hypothetical protein
MAISYFALCKSGLFLRSVSSLRRTRSSFLGKPRPKLRATISGFHIPLKPLQLYKHRRPHGTAWPAVPTRTNWPSRAGSGAPQYNFDVMPLSSRQSFCSLQCWRCSALCTTLRITPVVTSGCKPPMIRWIASFARMRSIRQSVQNGQFLCGPAQKPAGCFVASHANK